MKLINISFYLLILFLLTHLSFAQMISNEEDWSDLPVSVDPGYLHAPPSDAIVLFEGDDLSEWTNIAGGDPGWKVEDGKLIVVPGSGDIITNKSFGDVQLHVEWMIPDKDYGQGNSGIYLQGRYEVQIFNSYQNDSKIYYNGQTGSLYKQHAPLVNASRPRGKWDTFDIIFTAPRFRDDGKLMTPAVFTVLHNGILVQHNTELNGMTTHENLTKYEPHPLKQPLMIQDHGDPVQFRNIWIREL